jgi:putative FmdB family regulatory protein
MPIYEYECTQCGERLDVVQKVTDQPLRICSKCSGTLRKVLSQTAFVLKGSGWYVTDYPSETRKKAIEAEKPKVEKSKEEKPKEEPKTKEPTKVN